MASLNMLISELAHSVQQADSVPVRRALRLGIIHARNEIIRKSYDNNKNVDKILQQRFRLSLIDVPDGDLIITKGLPICGQKRTTNKVPRAVRLSNGIPFQSVHTVGVTFNKSIPFVKETSSQFYAHLPGMSSGADYDLINEYIYINVKKDNLLYVIKHIIVESPFEQPQTIQTETSDGVLNLAEVDDNNEFLLPEDMINAIKKIVLETFNPQVVRQTNEIPTPNLVK